MTVDASTIQSDVQTGFDDSGPDGADAFLSSLIGEDPSKKKPSTETQDEATDVQDTTETTTQDTGENTEGEQKAADPDDAEIEIKVGEEVKKATIKDLKRLYGQEAALTQKSQKVAEAQRIAEANNTRATTALNAMIAKAVERAKPYQEMDWLVLSQRMATEDFQVLRADAAAAQADLTFLQSELDGVVTKQRNDALANYQTAALECKRVLEDPEKGIPGFGAPLYNEMMQFAHSHGMTQAHQIVSPEALKVLHMAMLYAKSQKAASTAATKVNRAVQQATRVLKPNTSASQTTQASGRQKEAMRSLRQSGSVEDAASAFLASFSKDD